MIILPGLNEAPIQKNRGVWRGVVKKQDHQIAANTAFQDDPDLVMPVDADASYAFKSHIFTNAPSVSATINFAWVGPPGAVLTSLYDLVRSGLDTQHLAYTILGTDTSAVSISTLAPLQLRFAGVLQTAAAGLFRFRWRQLASNPRQNLLQSSYLKLMRCR